VLGNYETDINGDSNRPRNQEGWGLGLGIDYDLSKNTALYLRHRWFSFEDRSFAKDQFKGTETVFEIKLSF
jgi:opacity protein-like surface antigen